MFETFGQDLRRYGRTRRERARALALTPGLWATAAYRFARWSRELPRGVVRRVCGVASALLNLFAVVTSNIELHEAAEIGTGLYLPHAGYVVVGAVVIRPVPARVVAVGNPARVISLNGSFDLVAYEGTERDPARLAALAERTREEQVMI